MKTKSYLEIGIFLLFSNILFAQSDIRFSMGLNFVSAPQLREYINYSAPSNDLQPEISTYIEFAGEYGYKLNNQYQIGLETAYESKSVNYPAVPSGYVFDYSLISPTLIGYYISVSEGYKFKFGIGAGPRFAMVDESVYINRSDSYSSSGFGMLLKADGSTKLSELVFAYIGFDIRYNNLGELKSSSDNVLVNPNTNEGVSFNSFSAGIKLGISIIF